MSNTNPVDAAINAANEKAKEQVPATQQQQPQAVTQYQAPAATPVTIDDMMNAGLAVDNWLKVGFHGLTVSGNDDKLFKEFTATIDMNAVQPFEGLRFGKDPVTYMKTYDRVNCVEGGTWQEAIAQARAVDPKVRTYHSAEIPMLVEEDIEVDGELIAEAGDLLGYAPPVTGAKKFNQLIRELKKEGNDKATVRVKIGFEPKKKNTYTWGVVTFEFLGLAE